VRRPRPREGRETASTRRRSSSSRGPEPPPSPLPSPAAKLPRARGAKYWSASVAALKLPHVPSIGRRVLLSTVPFLVAPTAATADTLSSRLANAAGLDTERAKPAPKPVVNEGNDADQRFAELVAADLAAKEKKFGFPLDEEDKATFEAMLRNKYCGKQGLSAGWGLPGGPCRDSNGCDQAFMGGSAACITKRDKR